MRSTGGVARGPAILKTSCLAAGEFDPDEAKPILREDLHRARCSPTADSIIVSRMNTPNLVGEVGYVGRNYPDLFLPDRLWLARPKRGGRTDMRWLAYNLSSGAGSRTVRGLATGTSNSMKNIPKGRLLSLDLAVPAPEEQTHIADALEHVSNLVSALERLIIKKQSIAQGMRQQLLTGRTRLPGFVAPWRPVRLGDAGMTYGGLSGKTKDDFGHGPASFVTFMEVIAGPRLAGRRLERVVVRRNERQNRVERNDVLFNGSSETPGEVALSAVVDFEPSATTYLNSFCYGYRVNRRDSLDPTYLAYFFRSGGGRELVSSLAQGATRYNIAKTKFLELMPEFPPLDEQLAVANVLRDADDDIAAAAERLSKAKAIKQGMMQQLLSGRVRLPIQEVAS